jgi:two-component system, CitB family, response regulator MalR
MFNNVMLVEDDDVTMMLCKINIRKTNFAQNLVCCENGLEAINYLKLESEKLENERNIPDLILLDINMPVMNGWDFLEEFQKNLSSYFARTSIKILTSSIDPRDIEKSKSFPTVNEFISKPLNRDILISLLEKNQ